MHEFFFVFKGKRMIVPATAEKTIIEIQPAAKSKCISCDHKVGESD